MSLAPGVSWSRRALVWNSCEPGSFGKDISRAMKILFLSQQHLIRWRKHMPSASSQGSQALQEAEEAEESGLGFMSCNNVSHGQNS